MIGFLRRLFGRKKGQVRVEFSPAELRALRWYAECRKMSVDEFIRRASLASVPYNIERMMENERKGIALIDTAFDDEDIGIEVWKDHKPFCAYLDQTDELKESFTKCRGICTAEGRVGEGRAPCYWPNKSEFRCTWFKDAREQKRRRLAS